MKPNKKLISEIKEDIKKKGYGIGHISYGIKEETKEDILKKIINTLAIMFSIAMLFAIAMSLTATYLILNNTLCK